MKTIRYFITILFALFLIRLHGLVFAAAPSSLTEVKLDKPVGGEILPGGTAFQGDIKSSLIFSKIIPFVIKYAINLAAALSVIAIIIGGYQYLTAYGDTEKHKKAQNTIAYAAIGLILAITAYAIVKLITSINFT